MTAARERLTASRSTTPTAWSARFLNVVPTIDQFERMGAGASLGYWTWYLLAQRAPFPERVLLADSAGVLDHIFATWTSDPAAIDSAA